MRKCMSIHTRMMTLPPCALDCGPQVAFPLHPTLPCKSMAINPLLDRA